MILKKFLFTLGVLTAAVGVTYSLISAVGEHHMAFQEDHNQIGLLRLARNEPIYTQHGIIMGRAGQVYTLLNLGGDNGRTTIRLPNGEVGTLDEEDFVGVSHRSMIATQNQAVYADDEDGLGDIIGYIRPGDWISIRGEVMEHQGHPYIRRVGRGGEGAGLDGWVRAPWLEGPLN